ncbi:MAG: YidC/Oxa1 family membrane protein insertase [Flavobacteriales bacterium]|jgi:YidC/Oxa1 family membrane protein insertase
MDKNQIIGVVLIVALMAGFYFVNPPEEKVQEEQPTIEAAETTSNSPRTPEVAQPNLLNTELDSSQQAMVSAQLIDRYGIFAGATEGDGEQVTLENNRIKTVLNTKGGLFESATLVDGYQTYWDSIPVELWDPANSEMYFSFVNFGKGIQKSNEFIFTPSTKNASASEGSPAMVSMRLTTSDPSKYIEYNYTLSHDSYEVKTSVSFVGLDRQIDLADDTPVFSWEALGNRNEKGILEEQRHSSIFFREMGEDRDYLSEAREDDEQIEESLNWVAFKQNYFTAAVIADAGFKAGGDLYSNKAEETDSAHTTQFRAEIPLAVSPSAMSTTDLRFYFGPNDYAELQNLEVDEFGRIVDYGWWIFGWVNRNMIRPVFAFLSEHIASAGIVIIVLTIIIKMLLFPVTWKNYLSSAKMRVLKPEMDEIAAKFEGKDKAVDKQQATMALYRQTGVNPFAGCLPVLLQMPILYAMFRFFPASIELRGRGFLWADDLGAYDSIFSWSTHIPLLSDFYGNHISGFTVLMAISTFFYTRMNTANMPTTQQPGMPNMKVIMNIFPFMMLFFFNKFASGLSFYYLIANLMSIAQMVVIKNYIIDESKIRAKIEGNKAKPKKKGGFSQRLEEMQKLQQEKGKTQKK